ncbi:hypothetical protein MMC18_001867, partial [Xylographa bjoerkii]|nr:hypothetical protein [Xylographa bjoerkii]
MASKSTKAAMTSVHTAGIYADMTVDGPDIGTLVVIVDRAKNLPNRKTMGKQDPYCAARLGKEAKKTETDKRGGQTPRWDQELRFTVHDSPDYHQLKVSVFNDDKRTDLIGETWVSLDKVVVSGGGQSDVWHSLNCKGRYAGEIRIELTYYDTRPKEERTRSTSDLQITTENQERRAESANGPRQSQPVKRRPLPADPTLLDSSPLHPLMPDHAQSSPLPHTPQQYQNRPTIYTTPQSVYGSDIHSGIAYQEPAQKSHELSPSLPYYQQHDIEIYNKAPSTEQPSHGLYLPRYDQQPHTTNDEILFHNNHISNLRNVFSRPQIPYPTEEEENQIYPSQTLQQHITLDLDLPQLPQLPQLTPYNPTVLRPIAQNPHRYHTQQTSSLSSPIPVLNHNRSLGEFHQQSQSSICSEEPKQQESHYHHIKGHQQSPLRHRSHENRYTAVSSPIQPTNDDEGPPPPPPAHRSSGFNSLSGTDELVQRPNFGPMAAPAPLNIRHGRGSFSASPLVKTYTDPLQDDQVLSISPSSAQLSTTSAHQPPSYDAYASQRRRQSYDPKTDSLHSPTGQPMPPSLVPGYNPNMAEVEHQRIRQEKQPHPGQPYFSGRDVNETTWQHGRHGDAHAPHNSNDASRRNQNIRDGHTQRSPAPFVTESAVGPDPRTPARKSLSPQPQSGLREGVLSAVPFSPDSYEALNPNLKSASNINKSGPTYKTPEQGRDAYRQKAQEERLEEGPIIGSDGRVIDPSDHLPTETWAPEPEQKPPRKGPEITFRFRQSPLGAQPMPNSAPRPPRQTVIRPHSIATTVHSYSVDSVSPTTTGRNRLQKKARMSPTHANSSPVLPISDSTPPSFPLREHVNYGLSNSPTYSRSSPSAPPPVPAKIPMSTGQEDWGTDALSEEMRRIDIGVGVGTARTRRS